MTRASYTSAVAWIAANDDCTWVEHLAYTGDGSISVTGAMTCDLFGVDEARLRKDLHRELTRSRVRARRDGAFQGSPVYRGEFYHGGRWETVQSKLHLPLAYMTEAAAVAGAKLLLTQRYEAVQCAA